VTEWVYVTIDEFLLDISVKLINLHRKYISFKL